MALSDFYFFTPLLLPLANMYEVLSHNLNIMSLSFPVFLACCPAFPSVVNGVRAMICLLLLVKVFNMVEDHNTVLLIFTYIAD